MGLFGFVRKWLGGNAPQESSKAVEPPAAGKEETGRRQEGKSTPSPTAARKSNPVAETAGDGLGEGNQPSALPRKKEKENQAAGPSRPRPVQRRERELVIGLDFGTSCSKIVVGDPLSGQHYVVPSGNTELTQSPYLHGGILYKTSAEGYSLGPQQGAEEIKEIKLRLLAGDSAAELDSALYLGLLVRGTMDWLGDAHEDDYRNVDIVWFLNIGLPAKDATDEELAAKYKRIGQVALALALDKTMTVEQARRLLDGANHAQLADWAGRVSIYPEVAAELEAFRRADYFEPGKYLLVDVGAGTLDIATFAIGHGIDFLGRFTLYSTQVEPLGAFKLHEARLENLRRKGLRANEQAGMENLAYRIPEKRSDYVDGEPENRENILYHLEAAEKAFHEKAARAITSVVMATHVNLSRHHQQQLSPFRNGLDVFLCGGGARLPFYQGLRQSVEGKLRHYLAWEHGTGLTAHNLPLPRELIAPGISGEDYDRIAVAYGLSFQEIDLPQIRVADLQTEVQRSRASGMAVDAAGLHQIVQDLYYPAPPPWDEWPEIVLQRPVTLERLMHSQAYHGVPPFKVRHRFRNRLGRKVTEQSVIPDAAVIEELAVNQWRPRFRGE